MAKNPGKILEEQIKASCNSQKLFFYRIKDVPTTVLKANAKVSQNEFDSFIYKKPNLFPVELKSTSKRSISFDNKIIKKHQIEALHNTIQFDGILAGFIFNFREYDNFTCFVHIKDFIEIKYLSENEIIEYKYKSKLNKSSIGLDICKEVGVEIKNEKSKRGSKYTYDIDGLLDELILKYS